MTVKQKGKCRRAGTSLNSSLCQCVAAAKHIENPVHMLKLHVTEHTLKTQVVYLL